MISERLLYLFDKWISLFSSSKKNYININCIFQIESNYFVLGHQLRRFFG